MNRIQDITQKILNNVSSAVVGKEESAKYLLAALLCGGHALICDVPGTGKTLLTKAIASSLGLTYKRIQFTPDLLPSDITGIKYFNMKTSDFEFIKGPVFSNIVLADEINRATPKTQSGLLECMAECQVTIDGETHPLDKPFMVIATENPMESAGVYELPEAQLDRFLVKLQMKYPSHTESVQILKMYEKKQKTPNVLPVVTKDEIIAASQELDGIFVHDDLYSYITSICESTHHCDGVELGISPRGQLALLHVSKCFAAMDGRGYLLPDDIQTVAVNTLSHRLMLTPSASMKRFAAEEIISSVIKKIPVPTENFSSYA